MQTVHTSNKSGAAHPRLMIEELPAYAPELNPVEFIWSYLKYAKLANLNMPDLEALLECLGVGD